jgi:hypothetical protein
LAPGARTECFAGDDSIYDPNALPLDTVSIYDAVGKTYQPYTGEVRAFEDGTDLLDSSISSGQRLVKMDYTEEYAVASATSSNASYARMNSVIERKGGAQTREAVRMGRETDVNEEERS